MTAITAGLFTIYSDILKANPNHDERGRFSSGPGGGASKLTQLQRKAKRALEQVARHVGKDNVRTQRALKSVSQAFSSLKQLAARAGRKIWDVTRPIDWFDLMLAAGTAMVAIKSAAGSVDPTLGAAASVATLAYWAYRMYQTRPGRRK